MERAVFAATDKSIFALDKRAALCRLNREPSRTGSGTGTGTATGTGPVTEPEPEHAGLWTVLAVKDKVSGIMLVGTLKAETSTPRWQMQMLLLLLLLLESAAAFPACKVCPLIWLSARIEEPTRYVGGRAVLCQ